MDIVGAIEAGGTKFVVGIATVDGELLARTEFPTTTPRQSYTQALEFLTSDAKRAESLHGIGIGHFGPLNVDPASTDYGLISSTPKQGWTGARILDEVARHTDLPVAIDTDVNCAAIAEGRWGAGAGLDDLIYVTVGTGIGAGIICNGQVVYGRAHTEVGHMFLPVLEDDRDFAGSCPFHGALCVEGLAAGPAIRKRWGKSGSDLGVDHPAWKLEATYLAMLCINLVFATSHAKIILGGGVMQQTHIYPMIRERFDTLLNDYSDLSRLASSVDDLIVPTGLGNDSGILGAAAIASRFCERPAS